MVASAFVGCGERTALLLLLKKVQHKTMLANQPPLTPKKKEKKHRTGRTVIASSAEGVGGNEIRLRGFGLDTEKRDTAKRQFEIDVYSREKRNKNKNPKIFHRSQHIPPPTIPTHQKNCNATKTE